MSLFGSNPQSNPQQNSGGLSLNTNQSGNAGGLFGSRPAGTGLFGSNANQSTSNFGSTVGAPTSGGLFGSNPNPSTLNTGSLFGNTNQSGANPANTSSIFGNQNQNSNTIQNPPTTGSLFGASSGVQQNPNTSSILGGNRTSMFGSAAQPAQASNFGAGATSINQPQNTQVHGLQSSLYQPQNVPVGNTGHTMSHTQLQRLQFSGASTVPNEKSIADQLKTLVVKWNPNPENGVPSQTILRTYFYNAIEKAYAPFVYPSPGEDEKSWEEALSKKPEMPKVDGQETAMTYVPSQCVGFQELSSRLEKQAQTVQSMRARLHEMNNSLSAIMDTHQQRLIVKIAATKRQHQVLAQRCLRLATKVQVLRNRGYALDPAEEGLRKTLLHLESEVMNPAYNGREDEIWARLVSLRERTRWLEEESNRVSAQLNAQGAGTGGRAGNGAANSNGVPEDVLLKTRKILKDYDEQLGHLNRELEDVKREYEVWQQTQKQ